MDEQFMVTVIGIIWFLFWIATLIDVNIQYNKRKKQIHDNIHYSNEKDNL